MQLNDLSLDGTQITDGGLVYLQALLNWNTYRSPAPKSQTPGCTISKGLTELRMVAVVKARKSVKRGVIKLQVALPNCKIYH